MSVGAPERPFPFSWVSREELMSQEWFYTKDRKGKFGPVSPTELRGLLEAGRLQATDMVWKQGMKEWMPVNAIEEMLFGGSSNISRIVGEWSLPVAAALSLLAGLFAVLGVSIVGAVIAGLAILPGLIAAAVGFSSRKSMAYLGSAGTAAFVAIAALLFSIGAAVARGKIDEARQTTAKAEETTAKAAETVAKAAEVEEERTKAEAARKRAREDRERAEAALEEARKPAKEILDRTEAARDAAKKEADRNASILADILLRQKKLDAERKEFDAKRAMDEADLKKKREVVDQKEKDAVYALKEAGKKEEEAKKALKEAMDLEKAASAKDKEADEKLRDSREKEKEAADHHKKIANEYKKLVSLLIDPKKTKEAIHALDRIGPLPTSVPVDLCDVYGELCMTAVTDWKMLRPDALAALAKMKPPHVPLVKALIDVPQIGRGIPTDPSRLTAGGFDNLMSAIKAINDLPEFESAGLYVIERHLNLGARRDEEMGDVIAATAKRKLDWLLPNNSKQAQPIFDAEIEALATIALRASDNKKAVELLARAPESNLAKCYGKVRRAEVKRHVEKLMRDLKSPP
jgi:chemotaxis protein histidine kinase CheA